MLTVGLLGALWSSSAAMMAIVSAMNRALLATALWLLASLGFRYYAVNFGDYEATYGTVGGVIVLMLWFYITGFVLVIGAEMNAEIEHASPWGKAPGEKVPGTRRKTSA